MSFSEVALFENMFTRTFTLTLYRIDKVSEVNSIENTEIGTVFPVSRKLHCSKICSIELSP